MALKNTAPLGGARPAIKSKFNWVTKTGASLFKTLPFGGAVGVVGSGVVLWFFPEFIPEGWTAEAVLSMGMASGVVLHRLLDGVLGWFLEPVRRHVGARWEAWLRLEKVGHYQRRGMLPEKEALALIGKIVKEDVNVARKKK